MALGQFYHVAVCNKKPYWVYGGLQDNGCWGGPSMGLRGGPINEDVISINGGDGFVCRVDPNDPDLIYARARTAAWCATTCKTGERASIKPVPPGGRGGAGGGGGGGGGEAARRPDAIASTGTRRSSCRATTRTSSTAAATTSSAP